MRLDELKLRELDELKLYQEFSVDKAVPLLH